MHVAATCPECGQQYKIKSELADKTLRCKKCGAAFQAGPVADLAPASELTASDPLGRPVKTVPPGKKAFAAAPPKKAASSPLHPTLPATTRKKRSKSASGDDSGHESTVRHVGVTMTVLGITGFLLPMLDLQWKLIAYLGPENMYYVSLGLSILGAILIFVSYLDRLEIAIPTSVIICTAAIGLFWYSNSGSVEPERPQVGFRDPIERPGFPDIGHPRPPRAGLDPGTMAFPEPPGFGGNRGRVPGPPQFRPPAGSSGSGNGGSSSPNVGKAKDDPKPPIELKPFAQLGSPTRILKEIRYGESETDVTEMIGRNSGLEFADDAPAGGVLVGLRITLSENWNGAIRAIQPVYQVKDKYELGDTLGIPDGGVENVEEIARPSFAVAAMNIRSGIAVNAIQLVFARVRDGVMITSDTYTSDWIGADGGSAKTLSADGGYFVGLLGSYEEDVNSLQFAHTFQILPTPKNDFPVFSYNPERAKLLGPAGSNRGFAFGSVSPEGGILVGLRFAQGSSFGGAIHAIQPIYQVGDRYEFGKRHGKSGGTMSTVLARPGFAIGGLNVRSGLVLTAVQVIFCEVDGYELDLKKHYLADWVGTEGGTGYQLHSPGKIAVGVVGTMEDNLHSIGLQLATARIRD